MTNAIAAHQGPRVHVGQGEHYVSGDPDVMLSTILGSCVSACLRDDVRRVGGMNHFLLPEAGERTHDPSASSRYGAQAMELLINALLRAGARRENLKAKVFGGARMFDDLLDIGANNCRFVETFLGNEGIPVIGRSLGGRGARRIHYWPESGRAYVRVVQESQQIILDERKRVKETPPASDGAVELF